MRSIIKLDNMNDHLKLVPLLLERFEAKKSKDSHVFMFVKELLKKTESRFSAAECGDLAIMAGNYQKTKQQAIDKPTESNAKKVEEEVQERKTRAEEEGRRPVRGRRGRRVRPLRGPVRRPTSCRQLGANAVGCCPAGTPSPRRVEATRDTRTLPAC